MIVPERAGACDKVLGTGDSPRRPPRIPPRRGVYRVGRGRRGVTVAPGIGRSGPLRAQALSLNGLTHIVNVTFRGWGGGVLYDTYSAKYSPSTKPHPRNFTRTASGRRPHGEIRATSSERKICTWMIWGANQSRTCLIWKNPSPGDKIHPLV